VTPRVPRIWRLTRLSAPGRPATAIARNLYRDGLRSVPHQVALDHEMADRTPTVDVRVEHVSTLRQVRARLRHVARGDRRALLLYVIREMSYPEIAAVLGVSVAAVKSRIFRARDALAAAARTPRNGEQP
jgi:RNA polymerase sigma-70 factor, ECF subfamily